MNTLCIKGVYFSINPTPTPPTETFKLQFSHPNIVAVIRKTKDNELQSSIRWQPVQSATPRLSDSIARQAIQSW